MQTSAQASSSNGRLSLLPCDTLSVSHQSSFDVAAYTRDHSLHFDTLCFSILPTSASFLVVPLFRVLETLLLEGEVCDGSIAADVVPLH